MNHQIKDNLTELFENNKDKLANYSKILYSRACLTSGLTVDNSAEVSELICNIMLE